MKITLIPLTVLLLLDLACGASEPKLPDWPHVFPEAKFLRRMELEGIETYLFATDLKFEQLKTELKKRLGEGWKEKTFPPGYREKLKRGMGKSEEREKTALDTTTTFVIPAFPGLEIGLAAMAADEESGAEGKKTIAVISFDQKKPAGKEAHTNP